MLRALSELARARLDFARRPAQQIVDELRRPHPLLPAGASRAQIDDIGWALRAVAARLPWRSDCLIQSLAADRWLRSRGVTPTFRLGVSSPASDPLLAHAWIEADGIVVTGGKAVDRNNILIGE